MRRLVPSICFLFTAFLVSGWTQQLTLPVKPNSVRFAAIGDMGTGDSPQYEVAGQMVQFRQKFPFDFVIMLGDNIYGGHSPSDFERKFTLPYKPLLDAGVKFYAALGNHDDPNERFYQPFNMGGSRYYTYEKRNVRFFVLDSDYMDPPQLQWLENELQKASRDDWKICYFHHPLYSSGKTHGSSVELRSQIEPLFIQYGVNVVFSGHDHVYERVKPQHGIYYFTEGSAGQLRDGDLRRTDMTEKGFDRDQTFMLIEVSGDELNFQTLTRSGTTVDSGTIHKQAAAKPAAVAFPMLVPAVSGPPALAAFSFPRSSSVSLISLKASASKLLVTAIVLLMPAAPLPALAAVVPSSGFLMRLAELSDMPPHSQPLSPKGARGGNRLNSCPRPLWGDGGAQRQVRGFICHAIMQSSVGAPRSSGARAANDNQAAGPAKAETSSHQANSEADGPVPAKIIPPEPPIKPQPKSHSHRHKKKVRHKKAVPAKDAAFLFPPSTSSGATIQ